MFKLACHLMWQHLDSDGMLCIHSWAHKTRPGHFTHETFSVMHIEHMQGIVLVVWSGFEAVVAGGTRSEACKSDAFERL